MTEQDYAIYARHALHRLEIAAVATREMVEAGQYAEAYSNLQRVEALLVKARAEVSKAMVERRWRL